MKMWVMVGAEIVGEGEISGTPARPGTRAGKGKKSRVGLGFKRSERSTSVTRPEGLASIKP